MTPSDPDAPTLTELPVGTALWPLRLPAGKLLPLTRAADPTPAGPSARELAEVALESVHGLDAPLGRAVTPDDRVAVVLDEKLPAVAELLAAVVGHLVRAGIAPEAVTVVLPPGSTGSAWLDDLPDEYSDIRLETHDLEDPKTIAYLATTRKTSQRIYLNRTLVEADFVVALTGRRYDPTFGVAGAEAAIYPALGNPEAVAETVGAFSTKPPGAKPAPARGAADEVANLLGSPVFVQVIEGFGDTVREVVATLAARSGDGAARQDDYWRATAPVAAELVIATISGDPTRVTFLDLARAAAVGSRVVTPGGRVVVVCDAAPSLHEGAELIRQADDPEDARPVLKKRKPDDWPAAALWLRALRETNLFLASRYEPETVEELFATPLASAAELQRLADAAGRVVVIPDAHKSVVDLG